MIDQDDPLYLLFKELENGKEVPTFYESLEDGNPTDNFVCSLADEYGLVCIKKMGVGVPVATLTERGRAWLEAAEHVCPDRPIGMGIPTRIYKDNGITFHTYGNAPTMHFSDGDD